MQLILNYDMSSEENFNVVCDLMDINSFIDYNVAQIYFSNGDWPQNNLKVWKSEDFSWRFPMWDVDCGFNRHPDGMHDVRQLERITENELYPLIYLLDNDEFRHNFINRFADLLNTLFIPENVISLIEKCVAEIEHLMPDYFRRWGVRGYESVPYTTDEQAIDQWEQELQNLIIFANARPEYKRQYISDFFEINSIYQLTVDVSNQLAGYIQVNSIEITDGTAGISENVYPWTGKYFEDIPVKLKAIPLPGYKFSHWSGDIFSENESLIINPSCDKYVKAIFEQTDFYEEIIYFWMFDTDISNNTPLESIQSTFAINNEPAEIDFISCFESYPYESGHFYWRKSSMERRNAPTIINYSPEANYGIEVNQTDMRALQLTQPLIYDGEESNLIYRFSTVNRKNIRLSFAAMNEGAANTIKIDYLKNGNWICSDLTDSIINLSPIYELYEIDLSNIYYANDNEEFALRMRFYGENANEDAGNRITFNNIAISGQMTDEVSNVKTKESKLFANAYPNPFVNSINIESSETINQLVISDMKGKILKKINPDSKKHIISMQAFPSAVYIITLKTGYGTIDKSIVKL